MIIKFADRDRTALFRFENLIGVLIARPYKRDRGDNNISIDIGM